MKLSFRNSPSRTPVSGVAMGILGSIVLLAIACHFIDGASTAFANDRADWMHTARWGVMNHYLADWIARREQDDMNVERWNRLVDNFEVEALADQLASVGAGYYLITLGQNSGYYLAPNSAYDRFVGIMPSKCSRRDLVVDLHDALSKRGIPLMVYLPSGAPARDHTAVKALRWQDGPHRNREFQVMWELIIREWSLRWGDKVVGWWFDGCYWPNSMYRAAESPNFASFAAAARAGNPRSVVAFNPGVIPRLISITPYEDYTAGEINDLATLQIRRSYNGKLDGAQIHVLSFLGETWGTSPRRFTTSEVVRWGRQVRDAGGAITWDVPIQSNGTIAESYIEQLQTANSNLELE